MLNYSPAGIKPVIKSSLLFYKDEPLRKAFAKDVFIDARTKVRGIEDELMSLS